MAKNNIDLKKLKLPWITKDGYIDLKKFPIDSTLLETMSNDDEKFRNGCRTLGSMVHNERIEAVVFLYGLLEFYATNIERKIYVVEALQYARYIQTANVLFRELTMTVSSNTTRIYINTILKSMRFFPLDLVREGFEGLLKDKKWSYRMKHKFKEILGKNECKTDYEMDF